ncbi:MAG: transglutaminase domain-containing protein [Eubacteriales bacterium]|nr:transglutaminase domain-containing protein [Eubacteriales bacterium]
MEKNRDRIFQEFEDFCLALPGPAEEVKKRLESWNEEVVVALKYLYANMPYSDVGNYSFDTYLDYALQGVYLWKNSPYCREMPEEIFLNYVLYHRVNEEEIRPCRTLFWKRINERIAGMGMEQACLEVNYWCAGESEYRSTDERTSSALDVYRCGFGRCGEESGFTVNALRSVGIPARQIYVPKWSHCDDNHAWVEAWCDGTWHYLGACEPEAVLDKGWFTNAASRAMVIHSRWFDTVKPENGIAGVDGMNTMYSQLGRYAKTKQITIHVEDLDGCPLKGAQVLAEVMNYAEFAPVAKLMTGADGSVTMETGLGSLHIYAGYQGEFGELIADTREEDEFWCVLGAEPEEGFWVDFDMYAPVDTAGNKCRTTPEQEEENSRRLAEAAERRRKKTEHFRPLWKDCFLGYKTERANRLMSVLSEKDRLDALPEVLMEHYEESYVYRDQYPAELFLKYIWNPRIGDEVLTKWRRSIQGYFTYEQQEDFRKTPASIWEWIEEHIVAKDDKERLSVYTTPAAALKLGVAGRESRRILFVAIARTLGIPARLNPADGAMEYWTGGAFVRVLKKRKKDAHITLIENGDTLWTCFQNWTIARAGADGFCSLKLRDAVWKDGRLEIDVEPGAYRILTSNRLPNGNILAKRYDFQIEKGESREIVMELRQAALSNISDVG